MLKTIFMAGTMLAASPLLAQTAPVQTPPMTDTAPVAQTPPTTPDQAMPDAAQTPAGPATPATPVAAAPVANPADAVAQTVDTQFATYDKNGDGKLNRAEFNSWMVALKTQSDPSTNAATPATRKWLAGAFATADKDRNATITRTELTGYLGRQG